MRALGLMSGTSLDGVDAALVELRPRGESYAFELQRFVTIPFEDALRRRLENALPPQAGSVAATAELHADVGRAFARA
ncbi:MAG: anhydro-N-acetylmuramic acid kinase, partial [Candidatus Eremiobacteraeota bacterium]|nr:anhydro-N-acetylmuramic acid kinase [Candidatus Eremiobacteraeota bacterium]